MIKITAAVLLALSLAAASAPAISQTAPPKVCKNLLGKPIPCPLPKPAAKPGLLSHMTGHPVAPPPQHVGPPAPVVQHPGFGAPAPHPTPVVARPPMHPGIATGGASQSMRAGASALCKDGTYWHSKSHSGSCAKHGGVTTFY